MDIHAKTLSNDDELTPDFPGLYGAKFYSGTDPQDDKNKVIKILTTNTAHNVSSTTNIEGNSICQSPTSFVFEMKFYFESIWHYASRYLCIEFCNKANSRCFALNFRIPKDEEEAYCSRIEMELENESFEKISLYKDKWYCFTFEYYHQASSASSKLKIFIGEKGEKQQLVRDVFLKTEKDLPTRALLIHSAQKIKGVSYLDDLAFSLTDNDYNTDAEPQKIDEEKRKLYDFEDGIPSEKDFFIDMRLKKFDDFITMDPAVWSNSPKNGQPQHTHDVYEVLLVQTGEAVFVTKDEEVPISDGHIVIIPPNVRHAIISDKKYNLIAISGDFEQFSRFEECVVLHDNIFGEGKKLAELALYNRFSSEDYFTSLCNAYVHFILLNLEPPKSDMNVIIYKMTDRIKKNFDNSEFSIVQLLKESGYAKDYVRTKFFEITKMTPKKYLTTVRMKKAKELLNLCGNDVSISRIAEQCGIVDPAVFSKCFKQFYGISPKQYIKSKQK